MEALDLPVGLRPVGAGLLGLDAVLGAGVTPKVRRVGRPVVGEDPLDGDAAFGEPRHGPLQDTDRGGSGFVVVDLGVRRSGSDRR